MPAEKLTAKSRSIKVPGLRCIGEICFTDDGIIVKIPKDADAECARRTADLILGGKKVNFEIETRPEEQDDQESHK